MPCPQENLATRQLIRTNPQNQHEPKRPGVPAQIPCEAVGLRDAQVSYCNYLATTESSPAVFVISSTTGFISGLWLESINVTSALLG